MTLLIVEPIAIAFGTPYRSIDRSALTSLFARAEYRSRPSFSAGATRPLRRCTLGPLIRRDQQFHSIRPDDFLASPVQHGPSRVIPVDDSATELEQKKRPNRLIKQRAQSLAETRPTLCASITAIAHPSAASAITLRRTALDLAFVPLALAANGR